MGCGIPDELNGRYGSMKVNKDFWKNKRVLITGHTGFKGSWLCLLLSEMESNIFGYALDPPTTPSLFNEAKLEGLVSSYICDIRNYHKLLEIVQQCRPEIVFHMAAQPIVRESYNNPVDTYSVNVIGTVNLLEAIRHTPGVKAIVNVTTDKCYENKEWHWGYRENDPLGGHDPYSSSKACSELVTSSFRNSYFNLCDYFKHGVGIASARAGNVIGGGDWAKDRLIPDFMSSMIKGEEVKIRSPYAVRPWQHVLDPLTGYMVLAERLYTNGPAYSEAWNFGPDDSESKSVEWIVNRFTDLWGKGFTYTIDQNPHPHEASYLKLDCSKAKAKLEWLPFWDIDTALQCTVEWYKAWINKNNMRKFTINQIIDYLC